MSDIFSHRPPIHNPTLEERRKYWGEKGKKLPPRRRCVDFDGDCFGLDHLACWLHDTSTGSCPFLAALDKPEEER